ncbi:MAG: PIN domain-containing protein [Proteobacteria bacterium]|nr:PIN domain-containing protein [Pseudomonadota bacterium]
MKLFLDANVIFTAAYSAQGLSRGLFRLAAAGKCSLYTSPFAHEEAVRNIHNKAPGKLADLTVLMKQVEILPEPHPKWITWAAGLPLVRKDAPVLAAAIQGKVDIFVTGDRRDFGHLFGRALEGVKILTPADALKAVTLLG